MTRRQKQCMWLLLKVNGLAEVAPSQSSTSFSSTSHHRSFSSLLCSSLAKKKKKKPTLQYYREDHNAKMDFILLLSSSTVSLLIFIYTKSLIVLSDPLLASSVCHGHVKHNIISDAALRTQVFS